MWQVTPSSSEMDSHEELYSALTLFNICVIMTVCVCC